MAIKIANYYKPKKYNITIILYCTGVNFGPSHTIWEKCYMQGCMLSWYQLISLYQPLVYISSLKLSAVSDGCLIAPEM